MDLEETFQEILRAIAKSVRADIPSLIMRATLKKQSSSKPPATDESHTCTVHLADVPFTDEEITRVLNETSNKQLPMYIQIFDENDFASCLIDGTAAGPDLDSTKFNYQYMNVNILFKILIEKLKQQERKIIVKLDELECTGRDLLKLTCSQWLNDTLINTYFRLIKQRAKQDLYPTVYVFNSYFFTSLVKSGCENMSKWTKKRDDSRTIFDFDLVFIPVHLGKHWALCSIDNRSKDIKYYDSIVNSKNGEKLKYVQSYLKKEAEDKLGHVMDQATYKITVVTDIPQQTNDYDCGVFTLMYADFISRDIPIKFKQCNMNFFRNRMIMEILLKKLCTTYFYLQNKPSHKLAPSKLRNLKGSEVD